MGSLFILYLALFIEKINWTIFEKIGNDSFDLYLYSDSINYVFLFVAANIDAVETAEAAKAAAEMAEADAATDAAAETIVRTAQNAQMTLPQLSRKSVKSPSRANTRPVPAEQAMLPVPHLAR